MNGGEITNNTALNTNGTVIMVRFSQFVMNDGLICSNSGVYGTSNGRNAAIYVHSNGDFVMNGGAICHNEGRSRGGVDAPYTDGENGSTVTINDGKIIDNVSINNETKDVYGASTLVINGGSFSQNVDEWAGDGFVALYNEETGYYEIEVLSLFDVNRDGVVNQLDMTRAQRNYGQSSETGTLMGDIDGDGQVTVVDLVMIMTNFDVPFS